MAEDNTELPKLAPKRVKSDMRPDVRAEVREDSPAERAAKRVAEIRAAADRGEKVEPTFTVDVVDEQNETVARVEKLLYVRKKS